MELIKGSANLGKAIAAIAKSARKVNDQIHVCAVSCLAHAREHGDWTPAAQLCDALPTGQRVKALAYWFGHFSGGALKLSKTQDGFKADKSKWAGRKVESFDVDGAAKVTFGDLTTEKNPSVMSIDALLKMLAKKASAKEFNDDGQRTATRASIVLAASLKKTADELLRSPDFEALLKEEKAELEAEKILAAGEPAREREAA